MADLIGLGRQIGVKATDDIAALLALRPDCIVYMPLHPNVDELSQLLRAGVNVVTTASFITGRGYGEPARKQLQEAAIAGGVSLFGSGINPGWIDGVVATASSISGATLDGNNLYWINHTPKPMKLKREFRAVVEGTHMAGKMKAGFMGSYAFSAEKL